MSCCDSLKCGVHLISLFLSDFVSDLLFIPSLLKLCEKSFLFVHSGIVCVCYWSIHTAVSFKKI